MKLSVIVSVLALALAGCAASPAPQPRQFVDITPKAPASVTMEQATWSVTLPEGWKTKPLGNGSLGLDPSGTLAVAVQVQDLNSEDDPSDADFGGAAVLAALQLEDVTVMQAVQHQVDGRPGSATLFLIKESGIVMLQYAVGAGRKGYIVACGGPARSTIVETCKPILDTFHVKK